MAIRPHKDAHGLGWVLECDTPHCHTRYLPVAPARTPDQLAREARREGWRATPDPGGRPRPDQCPAHRKLCSICRAATTPPELAGAIVWRGERRQYGRHNNGVRRRSGRVLIYPPPEPQVDGHQIIATAAHQPSRAALAALGDHAQQWADAQGVSYTLTLADKDHPHLHYLPQEET